MDADVGDECEFCAPSWPGVCAGTHRIHASEIGIDFLEADSATGLEVGVSLGWEIVDAEETCECEHAESIVEAFDVRYAIVVSGVEVDEVGRGEVIRLEDRKSVV